MEKLRQKADTPDRNMMSKGQNNDSCVFSHVATPKPSKNRAGRARIMVA